MYFQKCNSHECSVHFFRGPCLEPSLHRDPLFVFELKFSLFCWFVELLDLFLSSYKYPEFDLFILPKIFLIFDLDFSGEAGATVVSFTVSLVSFVAKFGADPPWLLPFFNLPPSFL